MSGRVNRELELWHLRFGHLGNDNLLKLVKRNMVDGLKVDHPKDGRVKILCEPCIRGKSTREPFQRSSEKRTTRPWEVVHSDVCGPVYPVTWDGSSCYMTFTDDYTHVAIVLLIKSNNEVFYWFMEYAAMSAAHFRTKIPWLRCDNGGEYTGKAMKNF